MKRFQAIAFLVITIIYSCDEIDIENNKFINDPNHPSVKGKLKTKREVKQGNNARVDYFYNQNGYLSKEETYSGLKLSFTHIYERDQDGNKIKEYSYTSAAAPSSISTYFIYDYENGKLIKESYYRNGALQWYIEHRYKDANVMESRKFENDQLVHVSRVEYNPDGRISNNSVYDGEMEFEGTQRYEYRQDTTLIYGTDSEGVENPAPYQEIYNSRGQILEEAYLWLPPTGRRVTNRYFYNDAHLLIESHHFDAGFDESSGPLIIYQYEYF